MYTLVDSKRHIIGWDLETGEHGVFTHTAQQAVFPTEEAAWNYMDLLERLGLDVSGMTTEKMRNEAIDCRNYAAAAVEKLGLK